MLKFLLIACLFLTASCYRQPLEVYIDAISGDQLASNHVDTPDPRRFCPDIGQMLVVTWNLPRADLEREIVLTIRYGDRSETTHNLILTSMRGLKIFELINEEYCQKQGISTFKADLYEEGCLIETVQHMLWCDLITLDKERCDMQESEKADEDDGKIKWL